MNLREEIERKLGTYMCEICDEYEATDEILKLTRKRIDKLREEQLSNLNPTDEYVGILKGLRMARELFK